MKTKGRGQGLGCQGRERVKSWERSPDGKAGEGSEWEPWSECGTGLIGRTDSCGAGSGGSRGGQAPGALPGRRREMPLPLMDKVKKGQKK